MVSTGDLSKAVKIALSPSRLETYEAAVGASGDDDPRALALYAWNAQVSAALLVPLHICEVVMRNAVSEAIEAAHGARWPWSVGFERRLPAQNAGYSPRRDLQAARRGATTTGKVIPELRFVFWQRMFTDRFDQDIWNYHLLRVLPNLDGNSTVTQLRQQIYSDLEHVRRLRNRIAHHEPVFARDLSADLQRMVDLTGFRSRPTVDWMMSNQQASDLIRLRP
jgi:hypothetical protein